MQLASRLNPVIGLGVLAGLLLCGLAACGGGTASRTATPTPPTPTPSPTPSPTLSVPTRAVSFTTSDHVKLAGKLFGHGSTYIIFSNQTDTTAESWDGIAQQFAARGYSALAYDYRGKGESRGEWTPSTPLATDLRAAVAFARQQGARRIVLLGASIGGAVTATVAADGGVAAVVILSAPGKWPGLEVTDAVLRAITAPKLFLNSARDDYAADTQAMYDAAQPPKEIHIYPDIGHGIGLFSPASGYDTLARVSAFLDKYAPAG